MSEARIPLEVFQRVFYEDGDDKNLNQRRAFQKEGANDFKVNKLGKRPLAKEEPIPKYPHFERSHIPYNPPSTIYHRKVIKQPEPEYQPPPKVKPRKINPNNLSKKQQQFYGLSAGEQDMLLIEMKRKDNARRSQSVKVKSKEIDRDAFIRLNKGALCMGGDLNKLFPEKKVPVYQGDENNIQENLVNYSPMHYQDPNDFVRRKKSPNKKYDKIDYSKPIPNQAPQMYLREEGYLNEYRKEVIRYVNREPAKIESYLQPDFRPNRRTRSQKLKEEFCRRKIERMEIEARRQELNNEVRRRKEEEAAKRLQGPIQRLKPVDNPDKRMRDRKQRMRDDYESYMHSIQTLKEANAMGQTLLERVANDMANVVSHPRN